MPTSCTQVNVELQVKINHAANFSAYEMKIFVYGIYFVYLVFARFLFGVKIL